MYFLFSGAKKPPYYLDTLVWKIIAIVCYPDKRDKLNKTPFCISILTGPDKGPKNLKCFCYIIDHGVGHEEMFVCIQN